MAWLRLVRRHSARAYLRAHALAGNIDQRRLESAVSGDWRALPATRSGHTIRQMPSRVAVKTLDGIRTSEGS